jgi:hypothetical protein
MTKFTKNSILLFALAATAPSAHALNPILRDYSSVRAEGMGDVRYSTGLFEENLYANPARSTDNGETLLQLPQISVEASGATFGVVSSLLKSSSGLNAFANNVGKPLSARVQIVLPGIYVNHFITSKWSFGAAITTTAQTISEVSQSGAIDPTTFVAVGPVVNLARRFLDDDRLSVGVNAHVEERANSQSLFSLEQFIGGESISQVKNGGSGLGYDFDLGTTYKPHWALGGFKYELSFAVNNIMGGKYDNIKDHTVTGFDDDPFQSNRAYNVGISGLHDHFWFFKSVLLAVEMTDMGNNPDGSIYKCAHFGGEVRWKILIARAGVSQGYATGGLGVDLKFIQINVSTYAEELGLNPGVMEDRRYAAQIGIQI